MKTKYGITLFDFVTGTLWTYQIVIFTKENSVNVVSSSWLTTEEGIEQSWWPSKMTHSTDKEINKAVEIHEIPNPNKKGGKNFQLGN